MSLPVAKGSDRDLATAILTWRKLHDLPKASAEIRVIVEATRVGNFGNRHVGFKKNLRGLFHANSYEVLSGRGAECAAKPAFVMSDREARHLGQLFGGKTFCEVFVKMGDHFGKGIHRFAETAKDAANSDENP